MLDFLVNIIRTPVIVLGLVAFLGLILQRKNVSQVFSGTVKTSLGMIVLTAGTDLIVNEIQPFVTLFTGVFNLDGFVTSSEAVVGAIQGSVSDIASASAVILGGGFLVNILLARLSPLKYIFLTGHMMWILSVVIASSLYIGGFNLTMNMFIGSILQGTIMVILPAIAQPMVRRVTGNDNIAIAHLTTLGTVPAGYIGGWLGDKSKDAEKMKLPKSLEFFKDTSMSVSIVMGFFYLLVVLLAGPDNVSEFANGQNYIIFGILKALGFTAGILIMLQGIRMFLGELIPAFKGISDKLVPGAVPALDVPVLFAYAPTSLMIGFIFSVVGMVLAMFVSSWVFNVSPLVSIIGAFFTGGVAGVYGNASGGRRGAIIASFVYGFILIFFSGFIYTIFDYAAYGAAGVGHDTIDVMAIISIMNRPYIGIIAIFAVFLLACYIVSRSQKKKL